MDVLHICAGWQEWNGAANIARMLMDEQRREGHEVSFATWAKMRELRAADEVWIHCGWLPCLWWAALWGRNVHWMPEACYDPVRLRFHGWKKWLAGPFERFFLRRAKAIVATCEAEKGWIESYLGRRCPPIEVTDIKRFFQLEKSWSNELELESGVGGVEHVEGDGDNPSTHQPSTHKPTNRPNDKTGQTLFANKDLHILYLGRRHPLKGVEYLESAVQELSTHQPSTHKPTNQLRIVSDAFGEEKEKVWDWCDVLVLPTLSENFGLVIAEALERGKRVITTDGAPAWGDGNTYGGRLVYLKGYRDGSDEKRVELLKNAIERMCS